MTAHFTARRQLEHRLVRICSPTVAALWCLSSMAACGIDSYRLDNSGGGGDAGAIDSGGGDGDGGVVIVDATPTPDADLTDACVISEEVCGDNMDNDCDGMVDEGFDLDNDPGNCGACGNECFRIKAAGTCNMGTCEYECLSGYYDLNGDLADPLGDGCDYGPCIVTSMTDDICDLTDQDCDGAVDENVDLLMDPDNCMACGNVCQAINADSVCNSGVCEFTCMPGFVDTIPAIDGCEYQCPVFPGVQETCNNTDDDCDAVIDEGAGTNAPCTDPGFEPFGDTGECAFGTEICSFGAPTCSGYVGPAPEVCDDLDNDCDTNSDEDFDKQNDVNHCGGCFQLCAPANAIPDCNMGSCEILACLPGYVNSDNDVNTGCNYQCTPTGPEVCDGVDNDCDEAVDEGVTPPTNFCNNTGPCNGTTAVCAQSPCDPMSPVTWRCLYNNSPEVDACGDIPLQEALCDDMDGDCDGNIDESFGLKGTACDDGNIGACQGTGSFICDPMDPALLACNITDPGQTASAEVCNDIDDDCNGMVDDGAPDDMLMIDDGMGNMFFIYTYEASRPDADNLTVGAAEHRSCSKPDALPWRNVTWLEANQACQDAGRRLCTEAEWELACAGLANNTFPYGNVYDGEACNGRDYDPDCTGANDDILLPTGSAYGCPVPVNDTCVSDFGVYDMSGNLREWTATQVQMGPPATYRVRGGSYDNIEPGLTCQLDFISLQDDFFFSNLGFRCCSDMAP